MSVVVETVCTEAPGRELVVVSVEQVSPPSPSTQEASPAPGRRHDAGARRALAFVLSELVPPDEGRLGKGEDPGVGGIYS